MTIHRNLVFVLFLVLLSSVWAAENFQEYKALRVKLGVNINLSYQQVKQDPTAYKDKVIELQGKINGTIQSQEKTTILIRSLEFQEAFISLETSKAADLTQIPIGTNIRMLVKVVVEPGKMTNQPELELIDFVLGYMESLGKLEEDLKAAAQAQPAAQPSQTTYHRTESPSRFLDPRDLQFYIKAYKKAVLYFNKHLKPEAAELIAKSIIYYSSLYKVDARLVVAVIAVESGFKITAVSYKGAMGLGQLMPKTAAGLGVKDPFNPIENIWGAVRLIAGHLDKFAHILPNDRLVLALACYNAGSGAVKKYKGIPPYSETINYIKKVAKLYKALCGVKD